MPNHIVSSHNTLGKARKTFETGRKLKGIKTTKGALSSPTQREINSLTTKDGTRLKLHPKADTRLFKSSLGNPLNSLHDNFASYSNLG